MGVSMAALKAELPDSSLVSSLGSLEEGEAEFPGLDEKMKLPLSCSHQPRVKDTAQERHPVKGPKRQETWIQSRRAHRSPQASVSWPPLSLDENATCPLQEGTKEGRHCAGCLWEEPIVSVRSPTLTVATPVLSP